MAALSVGAQAPDFSLSGIDGKQYSFISQEDQEASQRYAQRFEPNFPLLVDDPADGWTVSCAYDPPATPTLFLVGSDGQVQLTGQGFSKADLNAIAESIASHLGVQPAVVAERDDGNPDFRPG